MSHSCSRTVVSPNIRFFRWKSTPTVVLWCPEKKLCTYLYGTQGDTVVVRDDTVDRAEAKLLTA